MLYFTVTSLRGKQLVLFLPLSLPSISGIIQAYSIATTGKKGTKKTKGRTNLSVPGKTDDRAKIPGILSLEMCPKITHSE